MEHRLYPRRSLRLEVELVRQECVIGKTCAIDASLDGIRLETRDIDLHTGQMVEVNLLSQKQPTGDPYHAHALVIYTNPDYIGLMLDDERWISDLLKAQDS